MEQMLKQILAEVQALRAEVAELKRQPAATDRVTDSFPAVSLTATVSDGKAYWKVKGGRFTKFGINAWPEVLQAVGLTDLDPLKPIDLTGWTAVYVTNDEDGKASKITQLIPPPAATEPGSDNGTGKSIFRAGDKVQVQGNNESRPGIIAGVGNDGLIAVKVGDHLLSLKPERIELSKMA